MPASISFSSTIPTTQPGGLYTHKELMEIAEVCRKSKTLVLADEIYALTTYDIETFVSMGTVYPEGTFVTGGLSKDRSSAGYRFGACILPSTCSEKRVTDFSKLAATLYTNITTPIQYAAVTAYSSNATIERYYRGDPGYTPDDGEVIVLRHSPRSRE